MQRLRPLGHDVKTLLHEVSILGPLGYEPNTLPLRHGAVIVMSRQNIYLLNSMYFIFARHLHPWPSFAYLEISSIVPNILGEWWPSIPPES